MALVVFQQIFINRNEFASLKRAIDKGALKISGYGDKLTELLSYMDKFEF